MYVFVKYPWFSLTLRKINEAPITELQNSTQLRIFRAQVRWYLNYRVSIQCNTNNLRCNEPTIKSTWLDELFYGIELWNINKKIPLLEHELEQNMNVSLICIFMDSACLQN